MTIETYVHEYMPGMGGWCSPPKAIKVYDYIKQRGLKHCVEIGVFAGRSLCAAGLACREIGGHIDGIDPYTYDAAQDDENDANKQWWAKINYDDVLKETMRHVNALEIQSAVTVVRKTSRQFFHSHAFQHAALDFLHIDGNHSEWNSTHDVVMWVPEVRRGGIICMDDMNWESTGTAVRFLKKQSDFLEFVSNDEQNCAFFQKK